MQLGLSGIWVFHWPTKHYTPTHRKQIQPSPQRLLPTSTGTLGQRSRLSPYCRQLLCKLFMCSLPPARQTIISAIWQNRQHQRTDLMLPFSCRQRSSVTRAAQRQSSADTHRRARERPGGDDEDVRRVRDALVLEQARVERRGAREDRRRGLRRVRVRLDEQHDARLKMTNRDAIAHDIRARAQDVVLDRPVRRQPPPPPLTPRKKRTLYHKTPRAWARS